MYLSCRKIGGKNLVVKYTLINQKCLFGDWNFEMIGWGFTPYQQYFTHLMVTVHKSIQLSWTIFQLVKPVHYPVTGRSVVVLTAISIILSAKGERHF